MGKLTTEPEEKVCHMVYARQGLLSIAILTSDPTECPAIGGTAVSITEQSDQLAPGEAGHTGPFLHRHSRTSLGTALLRWPSICQPHQSHLHLEQEFPTFPVL